MKLNDLVYIKRKLNEEFAKRCISADSEKVESLVKLLKDMDFPLLTYEEKLDLSEKLVFATYGSTFCKLVSNLINYEPRRHFPIAYKFLYEDYMKKAFNSEEEYIKLFEKFKEKSLIDMTLHAIYNYNQIYSVLHEELNNVKQKTITVAEYLNNNGSLSVLIYRLQQQGINNFDLNTRLNREETDVKKPLQKKL